MENQELEANKKKKLEELESIEFKYYCGMCLIIRDENEYLEEWLNWHIGQGIEHFYIYDHGSKRPVSEFVAALGENISSRVTIIDWSGSHINAHVDAYNDCLVRFGKESRWIGFMDADEHVRMNTGQSVPQFLKYYENYAGVFVIWNVYGADGRLKKSDEPLRERFKKISPSRACHGLGKVFVQPVLMKDMIIHNGHPEDGLIVVDEKKEYVEYGHLWKGNSTTNMICIDHYFTKSYEEWLEKLKRGTCNPHFRRDYNEFFQHNPDMTYCREEDNCPIQHFEVSTK
jgi:hypothetical protein